MTYARSEIVDSEEVSTYHCISRCVRRAFLCGKDPVSSQSFEHRREWIRGRLSTLVEIFAIEVIAYAAMSNHLHSLIRTRPDLSDKWRAEEVAVRWRKLFPLRRINGKPAKPNKEEISAIVGDKEIVKLYRERLSSISWFNRCLNENIARRANAEDECTGRFWEGRFKCQRVLDVAGILACSVYIDLNPVRAGIAETPEESDHTSVQDRIHEKINAAGGKVPARCRSWPKVPLLSISAATDKEVTLKEYLELVDETGRLIRDGKGSISDELSPILTRLKIKPEEWVSATKGFKGEFRRVVGAADLMREAAAKIQKCWFHGTSAAERIFGASRCAAKS